MLTRIFLIGVLAAGGSFAQNEPTKAGAGPKEEAKYFHLDFAVKELEGGKTVNSHAYAMTVATDQKMTSIRSGDKLPVSTVPKQHIYVDVGTNIDCWDVQEIEGKLALMVTADVSSSAGPPAAPQPIIRQVKWNSPVLVPLRRPTVIFLSADPSSKRQMELELTATPIN